MGHLQRLQPRESVTVDTITISALFRKLGAPQAEACITSCMTELTDLMRWTDRLLEQGAWTSAQDSARRAQAIAQDLGFISLTTVLGALAAACGAADTQAVRAIWERAKRIGDMSCVELWDLPQLRM
jgi:hypothetical protein